MILGLTAYLTIMKTLTILRSSLQILSIGIFFYQMKQAVTKYLEFPIVNKKSTVNIQKVQQPALYICCQNQYDYEKGEELGYGRNNSNIFKGRLENDTISFSSANGNKSFDDILKLTYNYSYEDFYINTFETKKVFIQPDGVCRKLLNYDYISNLQIQTKQHIRIHIVDSNTDNDVRIEASEVYGGPLELIPQMNIEKYELKVFQIQLKIQHDLKDGDTCTDYAKMNSSYQKCFEDLLEMKLQTVLDCVPPWMPLRYHNVCNKSIASLNKSTLNEYYTDMTDFFVRRNVDMLNECKIPCRRTSMFVKNLYYKSNFPNSGKIHMQFNPIVEVNKEMYSYDEFALIVELGSALGLWIGLSALHCVDLLFTYPTKIAEAILYLHKQSQRNKD